MAMETFSKPRKNNNSDDRDVPLLQLFTPFLVKKSSPFNFGTKKLSLPSAAISKMTHARQHLLDVLDSSTTLSGDLNDTRPEQELYISCFAEFVGEGKWAAEAKNLKFTWSGMFSPECSNSTEPAFELASFLVALANWHLSKAARLCSAIFNHTSDEANVKRAHKELLTASGLYQFVVDAGWPALISKSISKVPLELTAEGLQGLVSLCLAQASEITMDRAIFLEHAPSLISKIAMDTYDKYRSVSSSIRTYGEDAKFLCQYADLKASLCSAIAHWQHAQVLHASEEHGIAITALTESAKQLNICSEQLQAYNKSKAKGKVALALERWAPVNKAVTRDLENSKRNNSMIFYQSVPDTLPEPIAAQSVVALSPYELPSCPLDLNEVSEPEPTAASSTDTTSPAAAPPTSTRDSAQAIALREPLLSGEDKASDDAQKKGCGCVVM